MQHFKIEAVRSDGSDLKLLAFQHRMQHFNIETVRSDSFDLCSVHGLLMKLMAHLPYVSRTQLPQVPQREGKEWCHISYVLSCWQVVAVVDCSHSVLKSPINSRIKQKHLKVKAQHLKVKAEVDHVMSELEIRTCQ